jgi:hypothetical protein
LEFFIRFCGLAICNNAYGRGNFNTPRRHRPAGNEGEIINDKDLDCFGATLRDFSAASLQLFCCSTSPGCGLFGAASEPGHPVESKPSLDRSHAWRSAADRPSNAKLRDHARSNL